MLTRRAFVGTALAAPLAWNSQALAGDPWRPLARDVRAEFFRAWQAYVRLAFGRDELRPLAGEGSDFFAPGTSFGLTIVEALDTLYLMGFDREVERCGEWIDGSLEFAQNVPVNVFEMTIRMVGGLVAAHGVTGSESTRAKAIELGRRLLPAFESPTGIPYGRVNLLTAKPDSPVVGLAQAGTHLAEFAALSELSGDTRFLTASRRAIEAVLAMRSELGLLPSSVNVETGAPADTVARIDPPVDSFFEALWDGWELTGDRSLRRSYREAVAAVIEHQAVRRRTGLWFRPVDFRTGAPAGHEQSELSAFFAGQLAQSGRVRLGRDFWSSWRRLYERHKLLPEVVDTKSGAALSKRSDLRPEFADASLQLWLATGDDRYRRGAAVNWRREKRHCRVPNGFTVLGGDLTPGWWWSENMKYYWLLFSRTKRFDYRRHLLSTEGKVLRGLVPSAHAPAGP